MSIVHFVGGEKGGVGKSVFARALAQYFIDHSIKFAGVDADVSHGALLRFYAEYSRAADLESFASADEIMDRALGADRRVLVDLPAQSSRHLRAWLETADVASFASEMGVRLVFWHVSDGGFDSANELSRVRDTLGDGFTYVVVKNHGRSADFSQLVESPAFADIVARGAGVVDLPALEPVTMYHIDRHCLSFWAAANAADGPTALPPLGRRRAKRWLEQTYSGLDGVSGTM